MDNIVQNPYIYKPIVMLAGSTAKILTYARFIYIRSITGTAEVDPLRIAFGDLQEQILPTKMALKIPSSEIIKEFTLLNASADTITVSYALSIGEVIDYNLSIDYTVKTEEQGHPENEAERSPNVLYPIGDYSHLIKVEHEAYYVLGASNAGNPSIALTDDVGYSPISKNPMPNDIYQDPSQHQAREIIVKNFSNKPIYFVSQIYGNTFKLDEFFRCFPSLANPLDPANNYADINRNLCFKISPKKTINLKTRSGIVLIGNGEDIVQYIGGYYNCLITTDVQANPV